MVQAQTVDLNFESHNTLYFTHGLHPFAARCPPQLAHWAMESLVLLLTCPSKRIAYIISHNDTHVF
jgi:hypothetical protein